MAEMRVIQRHTFPEGRSRKEFPAYAKIIAVGEIRSDMGPGSIPKVWVWVETFVGTSPKRSDTHVITIIRSDQAIPDDAGEYIGTVPENWSELHVFDRRVGS